MSTENVYAAPVASLAEPEFTVPEDILKKIKAGWVAACISGVMTLVITGIAMSRTEASDFSAWNLIDVALIFGLAFGIFKKSRACAVIMLVYFVGGKIGAIAATGKFDGIVMGVIFAIFYWQAVVGTFAYHTHKKAAR
jgi:hypothetical protein